MSNRIISPPPTAPKIDDIVERDPVCNLIDQVLGGDAGAADLVEATLRRDLSAASRRAIRDAEIRRLGVWLAAALPGSAAHARAQIIAAAGAQLAARNSLPDRRPFAIFEQSERDLIRDRIRPFIGWVPWPAWRQVLEILEGGFAVNPR
jgi:hypothetical protein